MTAALLEGQQIMSDADSQPDNGDAPRRFRMPHWGILLLCGVVLIVIGGGLPLWLRVAERWSLIAEVEGTGGSWHTATPRPRWLPDFVPQAAYNNPFTPIHSIWLDHTAANDDLVRGIAEIGAV